MTMVAAGRRARVQLASGVSRVLRSGVVALVAGACTGVPGGDLQQQLDAVAAAEFTAIGSGGVVLVARDGRPLLRRAYGTADLELGVAMRPEHVLGVGSITKQFTAAAVLRLVAEGKVKLDDDVRVHVAEAETAGRRITVEQLLTHTSGLPNLVDREDFVAFARQRRSVAELLAATHGMTPRFEPGQGFYYSDSGYILLGALIERVAGRSYASYLEEELFRPLGMNDSRIADDSRIIPRRASGYSMRDGRVVQAELMSWSTPFAAGAAFSSVDDLLRWHLALRSGRVLPRELLERAWSGRTLPDGTYSGYGFGWKECSLAGHRTVEHGGFVNGYVANATQIPDEGLDVVVLVNNDGDVPDAGRLARRLARLVLAGSPEPRLARLGADQRQALTGRYQIAPGDVREVFERDGVLYSRRRGGRPFELEALSPTELTLAGDDGAFLMGFALGADGRAATVTTTLRCEPVDHARRIAESSSP